MFHVAFAWIGLLSIAACGARGAPGAAEPDAPASTSSAPKPAGKRSPCTLGADQTCNENPAVSAIWGRCTAAGTCECHPGFELSPSGYCRPAPAVGEP